MLLLSSILLALTISTTDNSDFFSLPLWMPTAVPSTQTPGSSDYATNNLSITVTNAAALYACFNAYCERCYYTSQGAVDAWDYSTYGPSDERNFIFGYTNGIHYGGVDLGVRTNAPSRGIIGLDRMRAISDGLKFSPSPAYFCRRPPSWDYDYMVVGSSFLEVETSYETWENLDRFVPNFDWKEYPYVGNFCYPNEMFLGMRNFMPDGVLVGSYSPEFLYGTRSICVDALENVAHGEKMDRWAGGAGGYTQTATTLTESIHHTFNTNTFTLASLQPTNLLQSVQPWMSSVGQLLSAVDRVHTASVIPGAVSNVYDHYTNTRTGSCVVVIQEEITIPESFNDGIDLTDPVSVSEGDWSVGAATVVNDTHSVGTYSGTHLYDLRVSEVIESSRIVPITEIFGKEIKYTAKLVADEYSMPFAASNCVIYSYIDESHHVGLFLNGLEIAGLPLEGEAEGVGVMFSSLARRSYGMDKTRPMVGDMTDKIRTLRSESVSGKYTVFGSLLVSDTASETCGTNDEDHVTRWKAASDDMTASAASEIAASIDSFASSAASKADEIAIPRWGNYHLPESYAYVPSDEVVYTGKVAHLNVGYVYTVGKMFDQTDYCTYTVDICEENGAYYLSNLRFYDGASEETLVPGRVSDDYVLYQVWPTITPELTGSHLPYDPPDRAVRRAVSDAALFQRLDFDFESLKKD